jgi:CBS domain-containing protein
VSPRAAARLATLGFDEVYDYSAGKADWGSAGLPLEGEADSSTRAGAYVRSDVPRCHPGERLEDVRARLSGGWDICFVVGEHDVVLGRLGRAALATDADVPVEEAMSEAPRTIRPSARLSEVVERMHRQRLSSLPVTRSDGRLRGLLMRTDAEAAISAQADVRASR